MDFIDQLRLLASRIPNQAGHLQTEEATKNALVMPFIKALGYDVFDPTEVRPELNADVGVKKGEKVDYAILRDGKPIMIFECKKYGTDLRTIHASQLFRYFTVTEARFGVLTNGVQYLFFTDLEQPNKMDERAFLEFNILDFKEHEVEELKKFSKTIFDLANILSTANELKYTREIQKVFAEQLASPSEEFVKLITAKVYTGRMTQQVRDQFTHLTRRGFQQFINERISERLKVALVTNEVQTQELAAAEPVMPAAESEPDVVTTPEEIEGFMIIRAILREVIEPKRVVMRDAKSYCAILFDDNNRKPICRLYFNGKQKSVGLFDGQKAEEKVQIGDLSDLYQHGDRFKEVAMAYGMA